MSESTERAVLAGGCFWGMQDLIRKRPGVVVDASRLHRRRRPERDLPQPRLARRGDRDRLRSRAGIVPWAARILLPDPRSDDEEPPGQRYRGELPIGDLLRRRRPDARSPRTPSPTSRPRVSGRARSSPRSLPWVPSGKPNPSTRTTWSGIRRATRATSCAPTGSCPAGKQTPEPRLSTRIGEARPGPGWGTLGLRAHSAAPHVDRHPPSVAARGLRSVPPRARIRLPRGRHPRGGQDDLRPHLCARHARRLGRGRCRRGPSAGRRRADEPPQGAVVPRGASTRAAARPRLVARPGSRAATCTGSSRPTSRSPCPKPPTRCAVWRPTEW